MSVYRETKGIAEEKHDGSSVYISFMCFTTTEILEQQINTCEIQSCSLIQVNPSWD